MIVMVKITVIIIIRTRIKIMITASKNNKTRNCINKAKNILSCQRFFTLIKVIWK